MEDSKLPKKPRVTPTLVKLTDSGRTIITSGQFHLPSVASYVLEQSLPRKHLPHGKWLSVGEIAALKGGGGSIQAKKQARKMLPRLSAHLLDEHSRVLLYEYDGRRVDRIKVFNPDTAGAVERQEAEHKLDQMRDRQDLSIARYTKARAIINADFGERRSDDEPKASVSA
jgi:hypothetical protein